MTSSPESPDIIEGWKAIADFFGRSEKTVRIWREKHALPVFRFMGRVVAKRAMLDLWRQTHLLPVGWK